MRFDLVVGAELERSEGKFVSREELRDKLIEALEEANPGDLMGDNDGQYMVETWEVEEQEQPSAKELRRAKQLHTDRKTLRDVLERPSNADAKSVAIPRKLLERLALPREDPPPAPAAPEHPQERTHRVFHSRTNPMSNCNQPACVAASKEAVNHG